MKRIVIAVDSFKGSLSSCEAANAFEEGFRRVFPLCEVQKVAIADGGEGTVEALVDTLNGSYIDVVVSGPLGRPVKARYGIIEQGKTAIIEMAAASGLPLLKMEERNPMQTSTYGTGELILDAIRRGCRNFLLGIGGSATNDCGVGLFRALGFRFLDKNSAELEGGGAILEQIASIDNRMVIKELKECNFTIACDVTNPLYGCNGAAHIFAPQKGATPQMVADLERGLRNFARVVENYNSVQIGELEGAGAAGGLGGGAKALLNARLERGVEMVLKSIKFDQIIKNCDLIVTGEGHLDKQTIMGKAPSGILRVASQQAIPTIAICGGISWCEELRNSLFSRIEIVTPPNMPLDEALKPECAKRNIRLAGERIANLFIHK